METLFSHVVHPMAVIGADRCVEYCTRGFADLVGRELAQIPGSPCHRLFGHGDERCGNGCPIDRAWETGRTVEALHARRGDDGTYVPDSVVATPLEDKRTLLEISNPSFVAGHLRMCASCKRIVIMGEWEPIELLLSRGGVEITHGLCDRCADATLRR